MTNSTPWQTRNLLTREKPLTCSEVGKIFNVDPKTVARWANSGKLVSFRTLGGHRRFEVPVIIALMAKYGLKVQGD